MTPGKQVSRCDLSVSNTWRTCGQTRSILGRSRHSCPHPGKSRGQIPSRGEKGEMYLQASHGPCVSSWEKNIAVGEGTRWEAWTAGAKAHLAPEVVSQAPCGRILAVPGKRSFLICKKGNLKQKSVWKAEAPLHSSVSLFRAPEHHFVR